MANYRRQVVLQAAASGGAHHHALLPVCFVGQLPAQAADHLEGPGMQAPKGVNGQWDDGQTLCLATGSRAAELPGLGLLHSVGPI